MRKGARVNLLDSLWEHPPRVLRQMSDAFTQAWDREDAEPIRAYFRGTRDQWRELQDLSIGWDRWASHDLSGPHKDAIYRYIDQKRAADPRIAPPPEHIDSRAIETWQGGFVDGIGEAFNEALDTPVDGLTDLPADTVRKGHELFERTRAWVHDNLWSL
jgi:hypothetical protein